MGRHLRTLSTTLGVAAVMLATTPALAQTASPTTEQEQAAPIDPQAMQILQSFAQFLARQPQFSFRWLMTSDEVIDGRDLRTSIESGTTLMRRDAGFVAHSEREGQLRDYYYDGKNFTVVAPDQKFYASAPFEGGYDSLVQVFEDRTATSLPLWSILSTSLPTSLTANIETASYNGRTLIEGREAHHISFTGFREDWQVWISTDPKSPLPLMIVGTDKDDAGWPRYSARFSDWNLSPNIGPSDFQFGPSAGFQRIAMPSLSGLIDKLADDAAANPLPDRR